MTKILLHVNDSVTDAKLKQLPYSYEYDPKTNTHSYEIINYGYQHLLPSCLINSLKLSESELIELAKTKFERGPYLFKLSTDQADTLNEVLQTYATAGLFEAKLRFKDSEIYVQTLTPLKKGLKSFCPEEYCTYLLFYVLLTYSLNFKSGFEPSFYFPLNLQSKSPEGLDLSESRFSHLKVLYSKQLPLKLANQLNSGTLNLFKYRLFSNRLESSLYHLELYLKNPSSIEVPKTFQPDSLLTTLDSLNFKYCSFNHLRSQGVPLLNPLGEKLSCFVPNPVLTLKLKDLPEQGYCWIGPDLYVWNLKSKLTLKFLKNKLRLSNYVISQQELVKSKRSFKLNKIYEGSLQKGSFKEFKRGFLLKLKY